MIQAAMGDTVRVHYVGTLADGSEFDSSAGGEPLELTIGAGALIAGFEQALVGMSPGERKTVTLGPEEAYGPYHADRVAEIERTEMPPDLDLAIGETLYAKDTPVGTLRLTIIALSDDMVTLDANHPLAGKDLTFDLHLVAVLSAAE